MGSGSFSVAAQEEKFDARGINRAIKRARVMGEV
ncbi:MAG: hypothetical protein ACJA0P_003382 [Planctomycetota bacterium]|jgi:hypothetical protein